MGVVAGGMALRIRDRRARTARDRPRPPGDRRTTIPTNHATTSTTPRTALRDLAGRGLARRRDDSVVGTARQRPSRPRRPPPGRRAVARGAAGRARRPARTGVSPIAAVAGRREPAAAGHLADQPAEAKDDRQPADDRPDERASGRARCARRSVPGAKSASRPPPRSGGGGAAVAPPSGRAPAVGRPRAASRPRPGASRRLGRPAGRSPPDEVVWVGRPATPAAVRWAPRSRARAAAAARLRLSAPRVPRRPRRGAGRRPAAGGPVPGTPARACAGPRTPSG